MTSSECISYTLKGNKEGRFAVALIKDNDVSFHMYTYDGIEDNKLDTSFEISSITKTITASLIQKEILKGNLKLNDTIDTILSYENDNHYSSIEELVTHTSGCKGYYFCFPFMKNFFTKENPFTGVTKEKIREQGRKLDLKEDSYPWLYSNFGFALLSLVLEEKSGKTCGDLINSYLRENNMANSYVTQGKSKIDKGWTWEKDDGYVAAGGVVSNIKDMVRYALLQLNEEESYVLESHKKIKDINECNPMWKALDINLDAMALSWVLDEKNGFIWHDGGTHNYNSYIGFKPETNSAVVVLSNLKPSYRINATVIGVKLLKEMQNL